MSAEPIPNHPSIDPATGFTEDKGYIYAFDAERKQIFIERMVANGLAIQNTCNELGLSYHTVQKHFNNDPAFRDAVKQARRDYADQLDGVSKVNAMNPKSVIERIFQLKALFPERYADGKRDSATQITINIDASAIQEAKKRAQMIDATIIDSTPEQVTKMVENQQGNSANFDGQNG